MVVPDSRPTPAAAAPPAKTALLLGASGLVGGELLALLLQLQDYARIYAVTRRPLPLEHPRLANRIIAFEQIERALKGALQCHDAFCCIGSTRRKAGSDVQFRAVDFDLTMACARAARAGGARRFVVVSSAGASPVATSLYLRVKGEVEEALATSGFDSLDIMQPGLLLGSRRELRPLELAAQLFMPLANPFLTGARAVYRGIAAREVAAAMITAARSGRRGIYVYAGDSLKSAGASLLGQLHPGS